MNGNHPQSNLATDPTTAIFNEEEIHGARVINRLRYIFGGLFLLMTLANLHTGHVLFNFTIVAMYLLVTALHTLVLRHDRWRQNRFFGYFTLFMDFCLIFGVTIFYAIDLTDHNFALSVKNPVLYFAILPLALTLLQLRTRYTITAIILFFVFYITIIVVAFYYHAPISPGWRDYVLGPGLLIQDLFASRPIVFLGLGLTLIYGVRRFRELIVRASRAEVQKAAFSQYFSPEIAGEIAENPEILNQGKRHPATILFSDIRGFTSLSEDLAPEELSKLLAEIRRIQAEAIFGNQGTLDKFIGDAVMATFGTPHPSDIAGRDSLNAVRAGVAMKRAMSKWNQERADRGLPPIQTGIGIHSGEVFSGNVGQAGHLEYTVLGDAVNTASRIESLCKRDELNSNFLISGRVAEELRQTRASFTDFQLEKRPSVRVRGRRHPIDLFAVIS